MARRITRHDAVRPEQGAHLSGRVGEWASEKPSRSGSALKRIGQPYRVVDYLCRSKKNASNEWDENLSVDNGNEAKDHV
jgi:hypothetical protein